MKISLRKTLNRLEGAFSPESGAPSVPDSLCTRCPKCGATVFQDELEAALHVCPACGHHFRLPARRRIELTCDKGSFEEWDAHLRPADPLEFPGYAAKLRAYAEKSGESDAVVTGKGAIRGLPCAIFAMDPGFMMGSMGSVVGEKITRLFERAAEEKLPVVGFALSGGARMQEGLHSLMQMAKTTGAVRLHSRAGLLYITVLTDPTTGGVTASFAMEGDILLAEPGALIGFAGPRVIEQTIRQKLPKGFQSAEFLLEKGFLDAVIPRRKLRRKLAQLLALHQQAGAEAASAATETENGGGMETPPRPLLDAYEILQKARASGRPSGKAFIKNLCTEFFELRGDRRFGDDHAIIGGVGRLGGQAVTVIAQEKGEDLNDRTRRNFGMAHPEGYRKALRLMRQAEKFGRPVLCLVDTSGAYCGLAAEERGQAYAIAENMGELMELRVPVLTLLMGEGGSGGALALAVADEVWMMENSVYSVISPEGCSSILWKTADRVREAAACLGITPHELLDMGFIEKIIPELEDTEAMFAALAREVSTAFARLAAQPPDARCAARYGRFRAFGVFTEQAD